ncbi:hypothetical protein OPV22_023250 [Ensete ventricosum]|uniref:Uncharacterized protein n=1 Tax=Ensete ventricosum TaxID=4639 RepID=A0AAV8QQ80_ENSVE|nr:hypothetical protein OPV22_023250 [Ensete ventricosum]
MCGPEHCLLYSRPKRCPPLGGTTGAKIGSWFPWESYKIWPENTRGLHLSPMMMLFCHKASSTASLQRSSPSSFGGVLGLLSVGDSFAILECLRVVHREMTIEATATTKATRKKGAAAALEVAEKFERGACRAMCVRVLLFDQALAF